MFVFVMLCITLIPTRDEVGLALLADCIEFRASSDRGWRKTNTEHLMDPACWLLVVD